MASLKEPINQPPFRLQTVLLLKVSEYAFEWDPIILSTSLVPITYTWSDHYQMKKIFEKQFYIVN